MRATLSRRDHRALVAGGAVILTLVALVRGLPSWRRWIRDARTQAAVATAGLARIEGRLRVQQPLTDSLSARGKRLIELAPMFLNGRTVPDAGATLAGLVSGAATSTVHVDAVQLLPAADSVPGSAFRRIAVRADATGDIRGVMQLIAALERGPALLAVRSLAIEQPDPAAPADRAEMLHVALTIEGLMLAPRRSARP